MTPTRKYTIATGAFYALTFPLIPYFRRNFRTGPCTPNLDFFFPVLLFLTALFGFIISVAGRLRGKKAFGGPALINGAALFILIMLGYWGRI